MSTPENRAPVAPDDALVITYADGRQDRAERLGRPGLLIRLERAYPDLDVRSAGEDLRVEHLFFLAWSALRIDKPEDERPPDDLLDWIDTVDSLDEEAADPPPVPTVEEVALGNAALGHDPSRVGAR